MCIKRSDVTAGGAFARPANFVALTQLPPPHSDNKG